MPVVVIKAIAGLLLLSVTTIGSLSIFNYKNTNYINGKYKNLEYEGVIDKQDEINIDGKNIKELIVYKRKGLVFRHPDKIMQYRNGSWDIYPAPDYEKTVSDIIKKLNKYADGKYKRKPEKQQPQQDLTDKLIEQGL